MVTVMAAQQKLLNVSVSWHVIDLHMDPACTYIEGFSLSLLPSSSYFLNQYVHHHSLHREIFVHFVHFDKGNPPCEPAARIWVRSETDIWKIGDLSLWNARMQWTKPSGTLLGDAT